EQAEAGNEQPWQQPAKRAHVMALPDLVQASAERYPVGGRGIARSGGRAKSSFGTAPRACGPSVSRRWCRSVSFPGGFILPRGPARLQLTAELLDLAEQPLQLLLHLLQPGVGRRHGLR